jgi:hypothetical protein
MLDDLADEDEAVVSFELELLRPLDVVDSEDKSEVEELVGLLDVLDVPNFDSESDNDELVALLDELEDAGFEEVLAVLVFPLDVVQALEDMKLVGSALDVLDVIVGAAVHSPVTKGTASTPEPIGIIFVP